MLPRDLTSLDIISCYGAVSTIIPMAGWVDVNVFVLQTRVPGRVFGRIFKLKDCIKKLPT